MNVNRVEFVCGRHIHPSTTLTHQLSQPLPRSNAVSSCITFITQELEQENPTPIILMILFVMVPGAWSAPHIQRKLGVRGALLFIVLLNTFATLFIQFFCYNPETASRFPIAAICYGIGIGATYPIQRTVFYSLSPFGQENEMISIFQACCMIIQFLPGIFYTGINEMLGSLRWAMSSLVLFWLIGWVFVFMIDFDKGVADAAKTAHLKYTDGVTSAKVSSAIAAEFRKSELANKKR